MLLILCFCGLPMSPINWDISGGVDVRELFIFSFSLETLPELQLIRVCVHRASLQLSAQRALPQCCCWAGNWVSAGNLCLGRRGALHHSCPSLVQLPFSLLKTSKPSGDRRFFFKPKCSEGKCLKRTDLVWCDLGCFFSGSILL